MGMKISSGNISGKRRNALLSEINVTPLVDVMLVLLIIFMITSPLLLAGVSVDLPDTNAKQVNSNENEPLSITISKNGDLYVMDLQIQYDQLIEKLKSVSKEKYDVRIFVRGDKEVSYGKIMEIVGEINKAGFTKIALISNIKQNEK